MLAADIGSQGLDTVGSEEALAIREGFGPFWLSFVSGKFLEPFRL